VNPLVECAIGATKNGHFEIAVDQHGLQLACARIGDFDFDVVGPGLYRSQKLDELGRCDGAHDAELERNFLQLGEVAGKLLCRVRLIEDLLQVGTDRAPKVGQMGIRPLATKQQAAEFLLQKLDRARERRLGDVAAFGRLGEIQLFGNRQEVADLNAFPWQYSRLTCSAHGRANPCAPGSQPRRRSRSPRPVRSARAVPEAVGRLSPILPRNVY
jgi:hypothetical protein